MGDLIKKPFIFTLLTATLLTACGGSGDITPENPTTTITPTTIEAPAVGNVTKVSECGTLPGQWAFSDITTGNPVSLTTYATTAMQRAYRKSWGGTTTAYAIIKQLSGYIPVWNEGRKLHIGDSLSLTTHNMIRSIIITGNASNPTVLVGTDGGLDIIGLNYNGNSFSVVSQKSVDAITRIRSVATAKNQILSAGEQPTEMVYMVADDNVLIAKLSDLQLGFGCMFVAYQAKDHPVDPANAKDKRLFHPTKVVADSTLAAFLTSSRLPEEFVSADQFKLALQNEWLSFQSTAYLIDIARQTPVEPFVMQLGKFDRFFASDINITSTAIFLFGTSYQLSAPTVLESGIATYNTPIGTPIANLWSGIPAKLGDFRMGRMDTFVSTAFIRGLDSIARVDNFFAGPTQQKWSVWPTKQPFDYVRSATMRSTTDEINVGVKTIVTVPQFLPTGPTTAIWEHKDYQNGLGEPTTVPYTAITKVLNIGNRSVSYNDTAKNATVFQSTVSDDYASFPIVNAQDNDSVADANNARLFHSGGLIFDVRHGTLGPRVRVYKDTITGDNICTAI